MTFTLFGCGGGGGGDESRTYDCVCGGDGGSRLAAAKSASDWVFDKLEPSSASRWQRISPAASVELESRTRVGLTAWKCPLPPLFNTSSS